MLVLLPILMLIAGAYVAFIAGKFSPGNQKIAGIMATLFSGIAFIGALILSGAIWNQYDSNAVQFLGLNIQTDILSYTLGSTTLTMDPLGALLTLVATGLTLVVSVYSITYMQKESRKEYFFPLMLLMVAGIAGIGLSNDLFTLYVFYELMCITSYILVAFKKDKWDSVEAGMKYVMLSAAGSAFALFGIALVFGQFHTLDLVAISGMEVLSTPLAGIAVMMLIIGFGVKAAIVPLHTWLPDAHSAAPTGISALLSGIVIETGVIILIKSLMIFRGAINFGELLIVLAIITMTVGNLMAFIQLSVKGPDLKRILAYSSIAQVGYILLGLGLGFAYASDMGFRGGLFHIMTHAFMKGLAFLAAGAIIYRIGTRDISKMKGIGYAMPITSLAFTIAALSLAGAPPLSGFMSEWMIFKAGVDVSTTIGGWGIVISIILLLNSALSLGYYLPIIKAFFLKPTRKWKGIKEAPTLMLIPIIILTAITITLGIWPDIGLRVIEPVVRFLMGGVI
ncbi:MAG: proton-conducting transporter membrane subunit [Thermoplasmata archaeon]|nr:proton-conducting transporter membrane subunit [Thermoplasmata archaeon]